MMSRQHILALEQSKLADNLKKMSEESSQASHVTKTSRGENDSDIVDEVSDQDLYSCYVLSASNTLRERYAFIRDQVVHLAKIDKDADSLEIVMAE